MTNDTAHRTSRSLSGLGSVIDAFIVSLAVLALAASFAVGWIEFSYGFAVENTVLFTVISMLLILTEAKSTVIVRHVTGGVVTPSWAFAFTLMLLGSPTGAILVMAVATTVADSLSGRPLFKIVFNVSQISLSLALGGLVLIAFGIRGPLFAEIELPTIRATAMIVSGIVVFGTNGVIVSRLLAWLEGARFLEIIRGKFLLSMTSDAAMLAIAPIFLITAKNNLLMLPLMGTATFFVYQTAQNALRRTHEANHDPLTGLLNRRAFNDQLDEFFSGAHPDEDLASVWILDLDRFKEVNDRLGHQTGDHVLQAFATRLVSELPSTATVARLGSDEFAVMISGTSTAETETMARQAVETLARPLTVDGFPISAGTSIGVAHYPAHARAQSELLHAADVAMYRAKRFRSGTEVYQPIGEAREKGRVTLLADVAGGLERGDFSLEYQPQYAVASRELTGVEALLRWDHPKHGRIGPGEFVSLTEHTDLIGPITDFVIATAIREIAPIPGLRVAVNVSARNLEDRHFASRLVKRLIEAGFETNRLEIEITESALSNDPERTTVVLDELRSAGVGVSIDDFGTGYSSFGTLRDTKIDRVKIDRSLVRLAARSSTDLHILRAMIDLAHGLDLDVVAEGVETIEVWNKLVELGCDNAQGYLMARPTPASKLTGLISRRFGERPERPEAFEPYVPIVRVPA